MNKILSHWEIGEQYAKLRLKNFIKNKLNNYGSGRDRPDIEFTSVFQHIFILEKFHQ